MIENVNKSVRRGQEVNGEYMDALFEEVTALYRLDQISTSSGKVSLGQLPAGSKALLICLAACWIGMGVYVVVDKLKKKKL